MNDARSIRPGTGLGLSARLLGLTILFVMLAEVLIYVPSISRFRKVYLEDQVRKASIAVLAVKASPDQQISLALTQDLLGRAGAYAIVLKTAERRMLMLSREMPPGIDVTFDLRDASMMEWIREAFMALVPTANRVMRVLADAPDDPEAIIEVLLDEAPMRAAMYAYSWRILTLSIVISLTTAGLVFFSLQWLMVRPIRQITDSMARFRDNPEDETIRPPATERCDEIGIAQRELAVLQQELRAALRQKTHLAALGTAVAKINHDLRNTLATAVLASDRLAQIDDPEVKRVTPRLYNAIRRAVALCSQTLNFVQDVRRVLRPSLWILGGLVDEIRAELQDHEAEKDALSVAKGVGCDLQIEADREQMFRVLLNLAVNAAQAGARNLSVDARQTDGSVVIDISDDGPGIGDSLRDLLFQPFAATKRGGGSGLGLAIAREILHAHGGELTLAASGPAGTTFRLVLPAPGFPGPVAQDPADRPKGLARLG
jgi:signal transduction histidine kinase